MNSDEEFENDIVSGKAVSFVQLNAQKSQFATIELKKQVETFTKCIFITAGTKSSEGQAIWFPEMGQALFN
jgi:hypothetical protein